ncbi:DUF6886 family protein [Pinibacter soli]|uniref:DUF4433 domain-containing protein n=1 Tax=Pinibacter soli TaxID=3044211 RepID=A0ABT6RFK9_9BACT|nr:DUF6886 family protein [Pinibacter soli]MDI3321241.1 hypothetical protein [Pinibacter soli]
MQLFHVSEEAGIKTFKPRPSPSKLDSITGNVVFAISDTMLHNYLLPRDCPRVCFYKTTESTSEDAERFLGNTTASYVVAVESGWWKKIKETSLYCYEFPSEDFVLLDICAGYYISNKETEPKAVAAIEDPVSAITERNVELRFVPDLWTLHDAVLRYALNFSMIRMRNAKSR